MLDPRIYRSGLIAVALAVFVLAFSLTDQQGSVGTTLAPDAFNGQNAYSAMKSLATRYPSRLPGSSADYDIATTVSHTLHANGFMVSTDLSKVRTAVGTKTVESVIGVRPGLSSGSIVVVAHRDSLHSPSIADLSGTAVLLELARVLAGETQHRSVVLASTSGSAGEAGAIQVAKSLGRPVEGVIALGDLTGAKSGEPLIVPWSNGPGVAPTMLRNTVAAALWGQAGLRPGGTSLAGQFAHLALPLTISEQGPFNAAGEPAVLLSLSGEQPPAADEPIGGPDRIGTMGRTVLNAVNALDTAGTVPAPSAYLVYDRKIVPPWAIRVLILALILPVLAVTVDGTARARRRGYPIWSSLVWVLAGALPFVIALGLTIGARAIGLLSIAPPGPLAPDAVPLGSSGIAVLVAVLVVIVGGLLARRPLVAALTRLRPAEQGRNPGAGAAVLIVMCLAAVLIWLRNPFAAALVIPALHLWMWILDPDRRLPRPAALALLVVGLAPPVLVVMYYAGALGLGPSGVLWSGLLLIAGGHVGVIAALEWSLLLGCVASVFVIAIRAVRAARVEAAPVTVRGPITYAGPGSLGGTESALRR